MISAHVSKAVLERMPRRFALGYPGEANHCVHISEDPLRTSALTTGYVGQFFFHAAVRLW